MHVVLQSDQTMISPTYFFNITNKSPRRQAASIDTTINLKLETDRIVWER